MDKTKLLGYDGNALDPQDILNKMFKPKPKEEKPKTEKELFSGSDKKKKSKKGKGYKKL